MHASGGRDVTVGAWKPHLPTRASLSPGGGGGQAPAGGWAAKRNLPGRTRTPSRWLFQLLLWLSG